MRGPQRFHAAPRPFDPWTAPWPSKRHDARRLVPGFETREAAHAEQVRRRRRLFAARSQEDREPRDHAEVMRACAPGRRCLLPICTKCLRRYRVWLAGEALRLFEAEPELIFVTIVPPRAAVAPGLGPGRVDVRRLMDWLRQVLHRLGCAWCVVGGVDGTYELPAGEWQLHFHLVAPAAARPAFEEVRRYCAETPTGSAPVVIRRVADRAACATYCCKGFWWERARFVDRTGAARVAKRRLGRRRHAEWLLWRGRQGLTDLTFLYRARRQGHRLVRVP
jgi:hypothetical protein